jgi:hypothetical protein
MLLTEGVVLRHYVSSEGIKVDHAKIEVIVRLPPPKTQKEVQIFLGHVGYYRQFIENFTKIVAPMFGLLIKDVDFVWTEQCQTAFETLKVKLSMAPFLRGPNWTLPFHISTDAFDTIVGSPKYHLFTNLSLHFHFTFNHIPLSHTLTLNHFLDYMGFRHIIF